MSVFCYSISGYHGHIVAVEVDIRRGLPGIDIVGLPGSEIREAKERMRVAIRNTGFQFPSGHITVNLSPADVPKNGVAFDLAIAVAILQTSEQALKDFSDNLLVLGELKLSGEVDPVKGVISALSEAVDRGISCFLIPSENYQEANALQAGLIAGIKHLSQLKENTINFKSPQADQEHVAVSLGPDFSDYYMSNDMYFALQIIAGGFHHALFMGPPGLGKTMAARRIPSLMPPLSISEALEVTRIYSISDLYKEFNGLIYMRPTRVPHHSATVEGMIGGGKYIMPGEISLAHNGILILDEAAEFKAKILQSLREPLEVHEVHISRAAKKYHFPANFQLLLTSNKCPCGNFSSSTDVCLCTRSELFQYWKKLGAALLDRIDIRIDFKQHIDRRLYSVQELKNMHENVLRISQVQEKRYQFEPYRWNSRIPVQDFKRFCVLDVHSEQFLEKKTQEHRLTIRGKYSVLRVARTLADLYHRKNILKNDIEKALQFRIRDSTLGFL